MRKSLMVLAICGAVSVPAVAQSNSGSAASAATTNQMQPAKPQTVKKRVCETTEEDSYSRLGGRKICKTIEVPVEQSGQDAQKTPSNTTPNAG